MVTEDETTTVHFTLERAPVGTITGQVTDVRGTPIEGAFVSVSDLVVLGYPIGYGFTDATGYFNIRIQVGTYHMIASAPPRFLSAHADVVVIRDEITMVSLQVAHDR